MFHIYFAQSSRNNKIYVGYTSKDPHERVKEHNSSSNAWSSKNKPLNLIYFESFVCKDDAKQREIFYKTGFGKRIKYAIIRELKDG